MDPATLATKGEVVFGSSLPMGFSAHSKQDPRDGTIYTWGLNKPPADRLVRGED
jgi:carotenoid cleavage dioxygenase-like enzyme